MTREQHSIIVVGAGGLGSAVLFHLARRGVKVLGIDRHAPPHDHGSSHGRTRIYRQAYYEAPEYVPLSLRALELWRELERASNSQLFVNTGALTIGRESGELFSGALCSAREHGIAHDVLTSTEAEQRFPAFRSPPGTVALFEPTAGVLFPEACVEAHLSLARRHGATIKLNEEVTAIESRGDGSAVVMTKAATYEADRVIVAAGAWAPRLIGRSDAFTITRETVHWFSSPSMNARAAVCPVSMIDDGSGPILYTIPDFGDGFKAGLHHAGRVVETPVPGEAIIDDERTPVAAMVKRYAPGGAGELRASTPCFYTTTRDHHFAIGPLPSQSAIILASACSGHGFKFVPALGESIAKLVLGDHAGLPQSLFDVARLIRTI